MPAPSASLAKRPNILLIEDDRTVVSLLTDMLGSAGYQLWPAQCASEAERLLAEMQPDLVILDLLLPDANGLLLCADLKADLGVPIILCSATRRRDDLLLGIKLGADDFLAKPFSVDELKARIELALRRSSSVEAPPRPVGTLVIDDARCRVLVADQVLPLTPIEYRVLQALAERPGEVVAYQELTQRVWGYYDQGVRHSLDVHVRRLRTKLAGAGPEAPHVATQRGFGYRLISPGPSISTGV